MTLKSVSLGLVLWSVLAVPAALAGNQPRGHIFNIDGEKCTFTQSTATESYLHSLNAQTGTLVFDDPNCMSAVGVAKDVNEMMIANFITAPYAQPDAAFATRGGEFRGGSALQTRGICIQSGRYPIVGVVAEFRYAGDHITGVKHAMAVQGCSE